MSVIFTIKGRLGNAIFRYLACSLYCIKYGLKYDTNRSHGLIIDDNNFKEFIRLDSLNEIKPLSIKNNLIFTGYYQHDRIYRKYKKQLFDYINENNHFIYTDGIDAGDGNCQKFNMKDIVNVNYDLPKIYNTVIHVRLGDMVNIGITTSLDCIKELVSNIILPKDSCIVLNKPKTDYEINFIKGLKEYIQNIHNIDIHIESNDILTDFNIMKKAEILVCSVSTISWCAALFSNNIKKCYMPNYTEKCNEFGFCKYPIENTILYKYY